MSDKKQTSFAVPNGFESMSGVAQQSFDSMSKAFSGWLTNANRMQAETIRFVNDRFNKDLQVLSRFGNCRKPEDFIALQSELMTELVSDYMAEGARFFALLGDAQKDAVQAAAPKR
jgi:hypothetical protein